MSATGYFYSPYEDPKLLDGVNLVGADIGVIVAYFAIVMAFGIWSSLRNRGSVSGYFLAGRSMFWIPVGASLFASNIGSGHFIGLAGSGASSGIGISVFELNALFVLLLLGWVFVPVYIASGVYTMPEYLRKRFGGQRIRVYLAVLALLLSIFTKVSADLYAGAVFIEQSLHWNLYAAILLLLAIAALFTITGGLTAVIWTDFIQTVIMVIGAFVLMVKCFIEQGGYNRIVDMYFKMYPNVTRQFLDNDPDINPNYTKYAKCGVPPANAMHLFRSIDDGNLPWLGVTAGLTVSAVWYWCSDQVIVQRALAAKNLSHAKAGTILAGYLKILPMWLLVVPGMVSRIMFPNWVGCVVPEECKRICKSENGCTNIAYPLLVLTLMPDGLRGMMLAVMMAALMSSLTSIFNSSSTLFTMDVWRRFRQSATDTELMIVGRVFVLFMVAVGIVWIPIVQNFSELFHYIQSITSYLAPPICAVYVLAVSWKRINEKGAFWSLVIGLVVGLIRFIWEFSYPKVPCGEEHRDKKPDIIAKVHYLHFGIILFCIVAITATIISLLTEPIPDKHLVRLTFLDRHNEDERVDISQAEGDASDDIEMQGKGAEANGATEPAAEVDEDPWWKRGLRWICGIEKRPAPPPLTPEQIAEMEKNQTSLYEVPLWRRVCNVNAIILMTVAVFLFGFFY